MHRLCVVVITAVLSAFSISALKAQQIYATSLNPYHMMVGVNKTSNLIFPYSIKSVDRGSADILAQKAKGVENILQVKAGKQDFVETNLTVVTSDGKFYSFLVSYAKEPSRLNISFETVRGALAIQQQRMVLSNNVNEAVFDSMAAGILNGRPFLHERTKAQKISLTLQSIYLQGNAMWFSLQLKNNSMINYTPSSIRFFVRDKKRGKRTAVQEVEVSPLYKSITEMIKGNQAGHLVLAFTPFTIPKVQELVIQIEEQNGGRSLSLNVNYRKLLKARRFPAEFNQ